MVVPDYNIWLAVQVFGCPFLVIAAVEFHSWGIKRYGCPPGVVRRTTASVFYFWLSSDFFGCPRCADNQNFEPWSALKLAIHCIKIVS